MALYRSDSFESINESTAWSEARRQGLLPDDAWTEAVDDGHHIAFFSRDEAFCEAANAHIQGGLWVSGEHEETIYKSWVDDDGEYHQDFIPTGKTVVEHSGYPRLEWTPMRGMVFTGWELRGPGRPKGAVKTEGIKKAHDITVTDEAWIHAKAQGNASQFIETLILAHKGTA